MTKTLSPKLAAKEKRNAEIVKEFQRRKKAGDMTMGIIDDLREKYKNAKGQPISEATVLRIIRENK